MYLFCFRSSVTLYIGYIYIEREREEVEEGEYTNVYDFPADIFTEKELDNQRFVFDAQIR